MGVVTSSFGTAKLIDIIRDVGIGRGGQACLAYFSYRVFTKALSRSMESTAVTYNTFRALTLQNNTISAAFSLARDALKIPGARAKFTMFCMILLTMFVLAMPTWVSAMTGYSAEFSPYVMDNEGSLIPAANFSPTFYIIHDGARLGEPYYDNYLVAIPWGASEPYIEESGTIGGFVTGIDIGQNTSTGTILYGCQIALSLWADSTNEAAWLNGLQSGNASNEKCSLLWLVSWYTSVNGFLGLNDSISTFRFPNSTNMTIEGAALNISSCYTLSRAAYDLTTDANVTQIVADTPWYSEPYGAAWLNPMTQKYDFNDTQTATFSYSNSSTVYNLADFGHHGSCQQVNSDTEVKLVYQWGFSFILLYFFLVAFLVWTVGMYILYMDAYLNSRLDARGRRIGLERAVLDLSAAIREGVGSQDTTFSSNDEIRQTVHGSKITYDDLPLEKLAPTRGTQFVAWCKRSKRTKPQG